MLNVAAAAKLELKVSLRVVQRRVEKKWHCFKSVLHYRTKRMMRSYTFNSAAGDCPLITRGTKMLHVRSFYSFNV